MTETAAAPAAARYVGARVKRAEDPRILTGRGNYVDDVALPGMLHAAFLRSPFPHARITTIDADAARAVPGVVAVYTHVEMNALTKPMQTGGMFGIPPIGPVFRALADTKVRFVGDPVAVVVAETRYIAEDACELIDVEYDPLPAIANMQTALDPNSDVIFDDLGSNIIGPPQPMTFGEVDEVFGSADRVITATIAQHRHQNVPMETRGCVASYDPATDELTFHVATQSPHMAKNLLAGFIDMPAEKIWVRAGDVGGAFGLKIGAAREDVAVCAASRDLGRPVKWIEDRSEHLMASGQAREESFDVEAAVTNDGMILGLKVKMTLDQGAYPAIPLFAGMFGMQIMRMMPGPYRMKALSFEGTTVVTNKCCYVAYRGPWAAETFVRERLVDIIARELGIDAVEIRRRNLVRRGEEPTAMITGPELAGVTSGESLERAVELVDYDGFRDRQRQARAEGRYLGLGMATFIEPAPGPREPGGGVLGGETAMLRLEPDGKITIITAQMPHGQSHETTLAQVAADQMGVPFEDVRVVFGDTKVAPPGMTGGSRSATFAGGAVLHGARALKEKVLAVAADLMEASADDLELADGSVRVRGVPARALSLAEVSRLAVEEPERLAPDTDRDLQVTQEYDGGAGGWSGGTHCCIVEVDVETGLVRLDRYLVVEDCGVVINPAVVDGQVRGGVAQGIGAVLLERSFYDDEAQYLSSTFMDYLLPTAVEIPPIEVHHLESVPLDPDVNFRGVGEGGMIVAPPTVTNAIEDALAPLGAKVREQHLPPSRILELLGTV